MDLTNVYDLMWLLLQTDPNLAGNPVVAAVGEADMDDVAEAVDAETLTPGNAQRWSLASSKRLLKNEFPHSRTSWSYSTLVQLRT